jgi:hypothetical protein
LGCGLVVATGEVRALVTVSGPGVAGMESRRDFGYFYFISIKTLQ